MTSATPARSIAPNKSVIQVVARNTAFMLSAQVLIKILAFAFNVYVVRKLGDAHFGRYSAALAYVAIFAMLTDLGTSSLSVREMARKKENIAWMVPDIMSLRAFLSVIVIAVITLSAWLLGKSPEMVLGIFVASCGLLLYAFQGPLDGVLIAQERLDFSSVFQILNQFVFIILGTLLLVAGTGYIGLLLASLSGVAAMGVASAFTIRRILALRFNRPDPRHWWSLLKRGFPFGIAGAASMLARRFDTVFMSFVLTDAAVGWYNVPYNLILMLLLLAQSLALSMYPTMVKEYDSGRGSIQATVQRAMRYLLLLSLPLAVGGMLLADRIILLLYGKEFLPAIPVMRILVWGLPALFLAEILGRTSSTLHLEKKVARVAIFTALANILLTVVFISEWGVTGAAVAMVGTRVVSIVTSCWIIGPAMLFKGNVLPLIRVFAAGIIMGVIVWLIRDSSFFTTFDNKMALLSLIGTGAVVYSVATLLFKAIRPGETRYVYQVIRRRLTPRAGRREKAS